ncbi:MAG TPA: dUTP diphosphatase [Chitinophagaceae bacterium]|nr:dUTP diphosphatase [Chitinophagaceae bacterium]HNF71748.1 dUTP diphosphatase [Chitinophagaceae bacterium]
MVQLPVINKSSYPLPDYQTPGSAGMDLYANLNLEISLAPMERVLVPTGLHIALPDGYEAQIRPRSGLAIKKGLTCLNTPGTIDSDYRGEIQVIIINLSNTVQQITPGERIAQMVVHRYERVHWKAVTILPESERNDSGFGSTGIH